MRIGEDSADHFAIRILPLRANVASIGTQLGSWNQEGQ